MPITFDHVTYEYPTDGTPVPAVRDVSLEIADGSFVCVLGENGSGKSTLAKLMNGLLVPTDGDVRVDGASTNTEDEDALFAIRKKVGMVFQNPDNQMIASIIEDEIAFGPENLGVPREEIEERITYALEAVGMTQHRHHTPYKLSGGQKQRITIARALIRNPSILILDEATSALDNISEYHVQKAISSSIKGRTTFIVAHRLSTIRDADRILVMENGRCVESGTFEELLAKKGKFYELKTLNDLNLKTAENALA